VDSRGKEILDGTTAKSSSESESDNPAEAKAEQVSSQPNGEDTTEPIALVLTAENLLDKIQLPNHNYERRAFALAQGTDILLCSAGKSNDGLLPRACYVYGVVCLSGPVRVGEYTCRSYFDPWVVLPKPVQSSKAWGGPNVVYVMKSPEHRETYHQVKRIVDELLRYPLTRQPLPSAASTRSESVQAPPVQEGVALKLQKLEMEKLALEVV
jgi:hypothetical protein